VRFADGALKVCTPSKNASEAIGLNKFKKISINNQKSIDFWRKCEKMKFRIVKIKVWCGSGEVGLEATIGRMEAIGPED
jgi:hypothetical protein